MKYNKSNKLRLFEICAGYGSQALALRRLREIYPEFDYELVGWAEFDPEPDANPDIDKQPAVIAHNALHPEGIGKNWGDITKITWSELPDFDLLTYSTPCQSVSQAGLQHGFTEGSGTRSSIIWNVRDCVKAKRPKFLMLENVKAMVSGKFVGMFNLWQNELEKLGYVNFAHVLNAKEFGVPQNRERIFLISIRFDDEEVVPNYHFPRPIPLELCLADVLEESVDEKFFLSDEMLARFCEKSLEEETVPSIDIDAMPKEDEDVDLENFFVA
ncbi:MAG: DNA (cytosine-5-)-methyltransferase [Prevotella sp.]|nr:DNA (cytosine-5-)-methyltransferase [Prevotella sp.]